MRTCH